MEFVSHFSVTLFFVHYETIWHKLLGFVFSYYFFYQRHETRVMTDTAKPWIWVNKLEINKKSTLKQKSRWHLGVHYKYKLCIYVCCIKITFGNAPWHSFRVKPIYTVTFYLYEFECIHCLLSQWVILDPKSIHLARKHYSTKCYEGARHCHFSWK